MSSAPAALADSAIRREPSPQAATPTSSSSIPEHPLLSHPKSCTIATPSRLISKKRSLACPATYLRGEPVFQEASFPIRHKARTRVILKPSMNPFLSAGTRWTRLPPAEILPCCGSNAWAAELAARARRG